MTILRPVRGRLVLAVLLQALSSAAGTGVLIAMAVIGDRLLRPAPDPAGIRNLAVLAVVAALLSVLLAAAATVLTHLADNALQLRLRRVLADRLGRVPLSWYSGRGSGQVKKAVHDDVQAMHYLVAHTALDVTAAAVTPLVAMVFLLTVSPWLALLALVPTITGAWLFRRAMAGAGPKMAAYGRAAAEINNAAVEFVDGIAVLKTFGRAGVAHRRFRTASDAFSDFFTAWAAGTTGITTASQLVVTAPVVLVVVLAAGVPAAAAGLLAPAALVAFVLLAPALAGPVATIGRHLQALRTGLSAAADVSALLDTPVVENGAAAVDPQDTTVRLHAVDFSYDGTTTVLSGVDLELRPGTVTALVGPSGAGKSTVARLIGRFHDATAGRITLGGVDLRELDPATLHRTVGFVLQEVTLLRTTVAANIALGRPQATRAEIEAAATAAQIHDRIVADPRGYDAVVGTDVAFSGGEAQRLSIARLLLADPPVLVLDEATAYADPHAEAQIQRALSALADGRTMLVIAHRLAGVRGADQIVVLDGGQVVERGRHEDLLAAGGRYSRMWRAQESTAVPALAEETR
ncbi:ABC transporter ATP-binding protein [Micromonospora sp. WMMD961]|uniref:ABC transporter ATP-binding protein n=1 Tax=Micromonospora sp. WMMD961 TaxID=3016100 RepID=UPI0024164E4F|nr:ABC transporter ATP-binding protein [Micromonospora sp. WMMD961]MDG4782324.1 ABC transporter ATP-binding protein [Micromonospora sp. WMMD961]